MFLFNQTRELNRYMLIRHLQTVMSTPYIIIADQNEYLIGFQVQLISLLAGRQILILI